VSATNGLVLFGNGRLGLSQTDWAVPHCRYFSFNLYSASSLDLIYDSQMVPDVGSIYPFQEGADRSATNRDYTLWDVCKGIRDQYNTTQREDAEHFPSPSADVGNWKTIATRLYRTNKGTDRTGGVSPPTIDALKADGSKARFPDYGIDAIDVVIADSSGRSGQGYGASRCHSRV